MKKVKQHNLKLLAFQMLVAFIICFSWSFFRSASAAPDPRDLEYKVDSKVPRLLIDTVQSEPVAAQFKHALYVEGTEFLQMDSAHAISSIREFLNWYKGNINKANSFPFLAKDKDGYYIIDQQAVANYLAFLKQSGFFSVSYLNIWKVFFNDQGVSLREEKLRDEIPDGFDLDFVLITQEPEIILDHIDQLQWRMVSMSRDVVLVSCVSSVDPSLAYEFEMYRNERGWLIGYISSPNFD